MPTIEPADVERFRGIIARQLGLQFDLGKTDLLRDVLRQRLKVRENDSPSAYLAFLDLASNKHEEIWELAAHLTVTETYFFRGSAQLRALTEAVIPQIVLARSSQRRLRILSAGCASGEEPYSIAILLREGFPDLRLWDIEILGFDINPAMIEKARTGHYQEWSFRETPRELRDKYFQANADDFVLSKSLRSMVRFEKKNLAGGYWTTPLQFDIIFCRNMMMYLVPEAGQSLIRSLTRALAPAGFLFLGYAENLRGLSLDFHLCNTHDGFYYQRRGDAVPLAAESPVRAGKVVKTVHTAGANALHGVSEGTRHLSLESKRPVKSVSKTEGSRVALSFSIELLRLERFSEALQMLGELPPETAGDPDVQLLRAGLLTNCGDLETAEALCRRILAYDDLNAGAHYLTALCRELAGDVPGAMEHDRAAIYLDADFAMPHMHLGRMAKRAADLTMARRELERAGSLLSREEASRILLFGGGFSREALVAFSRAELRACGGEL